MPAQCWIEPSMRQMSLPADVLDYILSFLESDFVTLKACSLAHPFLSQIAERYLYSTLKLQHGGVIACTGLQMSEFNQFLLNTPRIGSFVRTVVVQIRPELLSDPVHISSILQQLSLVKRVSLIQQDSRADLSWEKFPETFRQAFLKCLGLQSMKELSLESVTNFPLSVLKDCKTIKTLELDHSVVTGDTLAHPLPPIESLSLCGGQKYLHKVLPWLEKLNIRSLSFCGFLRDSKDSDVLSDLLACCANCLTTLDLNFMGDCMSCQSNQMFCD